ncbi:MAG: Grx4 family monothiol glutaredoxin [Acidobacteria bacterium]|nr:MAG: Grx4 family monothiol glutaredoxin [Acidobacteriota bacterium]
MSRKVMDEIRSEIQEHPLVLYMKGTKEAPQCGFSATMVEVLSSYSLPIKDINVLEDPEKWAAVKEFSEWPTIPQIYVGGEFIGGCDIVREMHAKGELEPVLRKATESKD